jgi:hypothetical protein
VTTPRGNDQNGGATYLVGVEAASLVRLDASIHPAGEARCPRLPIHSALSRDRSGACPYRRLIDDGSADY